MKSGRPRNIYLAISLISIIFFVYLSGKIGIIKSNIKGVSTSNPTVISPTITPSPDPDAPKSYLLMGYGGLNHEGEYLTDTNIILHIIPKEKKIFLISLPRDLWIPMPLENDKTINLKFNEAFVTGYSEKEYPDRPPQYKGKDGGANLAKYAASFISGLSINNYAVVDFNGFEKIIDSLGGADINVPYTFEDRFYPITGKEKDTCGKNDEEIKKITATASGDLFDEEFPCRFEDLKFNAGREHMDGTLALKFVRSRHSEFGGSDFGRSQRQHALIEAVKEKLLSPLFFIKIIPIAQNIMQYTKTDMNISGIAALVKEYGNIKDYTIKSIVLSDTNVLNQSYNEIGQYILIPKNGEWETIRQFIKDQILRP